MKRIVGMLGMVIILGIGCKKQPVSAVGSLAGTYSWSGIDTAKVIFDTNIHFGTTTGAITDTSFSIRVINDTAIIVSIFSPIYKFDGDVLYNTLTLIETNKTLQTMTFYAPPYVGYNYYCTSPPGHVAARTEYLTYNYGNQSLTFDCYLMDNLSEQWNFHLYSSGK